MDKCKLIHYGRNNLEFDYFMDGHKVEAVNEERDLGVTFDGSLKFSIHIRNIVNKANSRLGIIKRNFSNISKEVLLPLYKSLVRPLLEYCSVIWNPILKSDYIEIEKVQKRAKELVPAIRNLDYKDRLKYLKLDSLGFRRRRNDMIQVYRIIHNVDKVDREKFFELHTESITRGHSLKLKKTRVSHKLRQNSFSIRIINDWNHLKEETVTAGTINSFKSQLAIEWGDHPERYLDNW
jgi:hypothetical protein